MDGGRPSTHVGPPIECHGSFLARIPMRRAWRRRHVRTLAAGVREICVFCSFFVDPELLQNGNLF